MLSTSSGVERGNRVADHRSILCCAT